MAQEKKSAALYVSEIVGEHGERPQLEEMLQLAASRPRPFDVVIVYRPEVLGTPEDIEITRARLAEHGVELEFVHSGKNDKPWENR